MPQERALQGRISVAFDICKNALRMERQARQNVSAEAAIVSGEAMQFMFCSCLQCIWLLELNLVVMTAHKLWCQRVIQTQFPHGVCESMVANHVTCCRCGLPGC